MQKIELRIDELIKEKEKIIGRSIRQMDVCAATGIPQGTLSRYVNGHLIRFDKEILEKLMHYFDCDLNTLFRFTEQ